MLLRSDAFLRFAEHLAHHEALEHGAAQPLAREMGVPYTTLIEWWRHFEFHRALLVFADGVRVDRQRLLQVLVAHRVTRLTPRVSRGTSLAPREVSAALTAQGVPHALAMLSAANEWAFFEPRREIQIYVAAQDLTRARAAVPADERGPYHVEMFSDNPAHLQIVRRGDLPVTGKFLTLLDCRAHPEGGAHASFLERNLIRWGKDA